MAVGDYAALMFFGALVAAVFLARFVLSAIATGFAVGQGSIALSASTESGTCGARRVAHQQPVVLGRRSRDAVGTGYRCGRG